MNIESLSDALGQHYQHLRELLQGIERAVQCHEWGRCSERAAALHELLGRQIRFEEGEIFPAVFGPAANAQVDGRLREEHEELRNLTALLGLSSPAHDPAGWQSVLVELGGRLGEHIESEAGAFLANAGQVASGTVERLRARLAQVAPPAAAVNEYFIDVSGMDPPGPFVRIMEALDAGHLPLRVRIHREPLPLYAALAERGFTHRTRVLDDGCFEIRIARVVDEPGNA